MYICIEWTVNDVLGNIYRFVLVDILYPLYCLKGYISIKTKKVNIDQDTLTVHVVHRVPTTGPSEGLKIRGCQ